MIKLAISIIFIIILSSCKMQDSKKITDIIVDKKNQNKKSNSITRYKVFETNNKLSNIIFAPKTGKTHQIRIVAKHLGCPIVGDTKYNKQNKYNLHGRSGNLVALFSVYLPKY